MMCDRPADTGAAAPLLPSAGGEALVAEFRRQARVLLELRGAYPGYAFWWERRCLARPVLVARRLPEMSCQAAHQNLALAQRS